jgi:hypothetical protein
MSGSEMQHQSCNQDGGFRRQGSSSNLEPEACADCSVVVSQQQEAEKQTSALRRCGQSGAVVVAGLSGLRSPLPPSASDAPQSRRQSPVATQDELLLCAWSLQLSPPSKTNLLVRPHPRPCPAEPSRRPHPRSTAPSPSPVSPYPRLFSAISISGTLCAAFPTRLHFQHSSAAQPSTPQLNRSCKQTNNSRRILCHRHYTRIARSHQHAPRFTRSPTAAD